MGIYDELGKELGDFLKNRVGEGIIPAKVIAVDEANFVVDVRDVQGNDIYDVRFRAGQDGDDHIILLPAPNSWVLIGRLSRGESWAVLMVSEVQKVSVSVGLSAFEVDEDGTLIQRGAETLKSIVTDLLTALELLTVTCAAPGAPSTPPLNLASFTALKTRVNNLLK